jgi:gliding motility-associated-like protein
MTSHINASGGLYNTNNGSTSTQFIGFGDSDLEALSEHRTYDAAVLEFDFIPLSDTIRFRYVFASEEYPEYNGTRFNDIFAFLLSGPGYDTPVNIARLLGSDMIVSIDNANGKYLEFDGLTVILEAVAVVEPCERYHIKLAIADVADPLLDSGVFLESKSFQTNGMEVEVITQFGDNTMVEGCTDAQVIFSFDKPAEEDVSLYYNFFGVANDQIDFIHDFPANVEIDKGEQQANYFITPLVDNVSEFPELLYLEYQLPECARPDTVALFIKDDGLLEVTPELVKIDLGVPNQIQLNATFLGDLIGTFRWEPPTGLSDPTSARPVATVSDTMTYTVFFESGTCKQERQVRIIEQKNFALYVPNVFTPNGDGINDSFTFNYPLDVSFVYELMIFDRWGDLVFSSEGSNERDDVFWNGLFKNREAPTGVYVYLIKVDIEDEKSQVFKGDVTLIR